MGTNDVVDISQLHISKLEEGEFIKSFDCGDADLNDFILREAPYPLQPNDDDTHTRLLYFDLKDYKDAFQN